MRGRSKRRVSEPNRTVAAGANYPRLDVGRIRAERAAAVTLDRPDPPTNPDLNGTARRHPTTRADTEEYSDRVETPRPVCAISPGLAGSGPIWEALTDLGFEVRDLQDADDPTRDIRASRLLIAILGHEPSAAVLLEVGMALGLKRPVLLVAESTDTLPAALLSRPTIMSRGLAPDEVRAQVTAFAQVLAKPRTPTKPRTTPTTVEAEHRPPRYTSEPLSHPGSRQRVSTPPRRNYFESESAYEVASLLTESGGLVVAQDLGAHGTNMPDLAVSFPNLGTGFSTVLVEIAGLRADTVAKREQLEAACRERGVLLALLVTLDDFPQTQFLRGVATLSLSSLRRLVEDDEFGSWLVKARNRVVHGAD
jgi:hypothetical protein